MEVLRAAGLDQLLEPRFVVVDDSGGTDAAVAALEDLDNVLVVTPPFNVGHQRALVFGLRTLATEVHEDDFVVTLDADGEDRPEDLPRLLEPLLRAPTNRRQVVLAARTRRRETLAFKILYFFFKHLFLLATGTLIRSGNYAAYRGWLARHILFHPHFDLCYSSSLLSLNLQTIRVPCERGSRYAGQSKMSYVKLVMHGVRMLMPFADRIAVRGMIVFSFFFFLGLMVGAGAVAVRLFTEFAIPGWATYVILLSLLLCGMALGSSTLLFSLFVQTHSQSMSHLDIHEGARLAPAARAALAAPTRKIT
jgi:glycosyltransferase involved in cell wall biosynthesis